MGMPYTIAKTTCRPSWALQRESWRRQTVSCLLCCSNTALLKLIYRRGMDWDISSKGSGFTLFISAATHCVQHSAQEHSTLLSVATEPRELQATANDMAATQPFEMKHLNLATLLFLSLGLKPSPCLLFTCCPDRATNHSPINFPDALNNRIPFSRAYTWPVTWEVMCCLKRIFCQCSLSKLQPHQVSSGTVFEQSRR